MYLLLNIILHTILLQSLRPVQSLLFEKDIINVLKKNSDLSDIERLAKLQFTEFPRLIIGKDLGTIYSNVSLGTPSQLQRLSIDIAQPYVWVRSGRNSTECDKPGSFCVNYSEYYANASNTSRVLNNNYIQNIFFVDGNAISGATYSDRILFPNMTYGNDDINIHRNSTRNFTLNATIDTHNLSVSNISFFDAYNYSSLRYGALGLGGGLVSTNLGVTGPSDPFSLLNALLNSGVIQTASYSMWFANGSSYIDTKHFPYEEKKSDYGLIVFGGVDSSLIDGTFQSFTMIPYEDTSDGLTTSGYPILPMGPIYIIANSGRTLNLTTLDFLEPVLLDSRITNSRLPASFIIQVAIQLEAMYLESLDRWVVPCSLADYNVNFDFSFGSVRIRVPLEDFLVPSGLTGDNKTIHFSQNEDACYLAMYPNTDIGFNILGTPFLKNAVIAVDHSSSQIAIGKAISGKDIYSNNINSLIPSLSSSISSDSTPSTVQAIASGTIPFAITRNNSQYNSLTMRASKIGSEIPVFPGDFWGTVDSNGLVTIGRSFYETRQRSTSTSSSSLFANLSFNSASQKTASGAGTSLKPMKSFYPHKSTPWAWISILMCSILFAIVIL
ncbi:hypothetical protein TBLA_0H01680 [Henningerozyma blattae CBS 6284]|uniref:Peptidase A1 domain-containing protein n=1 Tax=Henningerozyma blattae (strain ATCC 34711 / CBS 6284 / DSM 70876 / NBRC 10599 / NRRL Y-10934 / UCD 77-7) TaxID=1071380 RepID=I2H7V3_HENB6|nr:hypothetical protein TBLA_0H01680 [Tetrapisispora blattae CBS 6284]CCH62455.1 hypothetical protein TBLA_0H01680 [Tetrapisispora blattae CBS 6284]